MKLTLIPAAFIFCIISVNQSFAQNGKSELNVLHAPPANLVIDGDIKEWGDSLRYYNAEKRINFAIANDKDDLYIAVRVNDRIDQLRMLRSGLTFSIDPKGRKKETFSITFPLNVQGGVPMLDLKAENSVSQADRDELLRERLTTLRGIKVEGFKDIEGDMITTSNTYGIQTAINYDDKGYLVYEAAIPLKFFHADDIMKNEWAFNIKINGFKRPDNPAEGGEERQGGRGGRGGGSGFSGGGGRGGHGGRSGGGGRSNTSDGAELFKSKDFWEKFYLSK